MDPLLVYGLAFIVTCFLMLIMVRARSRNVAPTTISPLELETRVKILEEQREFDDDRRARARGQLLTLSRRMTRLERRLEDEPELEELEEEDLEDEEFPEEAYDELKRKRQQQGGAGG